MEESLCTFLSCLVAPQMAAVKLEAWDKAPAWPMAWVGLTDVALLPRRNRALFLQSKFCITLQEHDRGRRIRRSGRYLAGGSAPLGLPVE